MSEESLHKIPLALQRRLAGAPTATMFLLLHVSETGEAQRAAIESAGFVVRHQTSLIPCYAVSGAGQGLKALLNESWLVRVEDDGVVKTM
jgi:hypothetical protein